jgi:hypothetical protein
MKYEIVKTLPVARFFYKGNHTHPVRRTVLVTESTKDFIKGYELRNGNLVKNAEKAPIKTYKRNKIAKGASLRLDNPMRKLSPNKSTLVRKPLIDIIASGI